MDSWFIVYIAGMLLVMWLFFIRPQSKKAKEQANFANTIQKGAKVITTGGIHGKVIRVDDNGSLLLEIDNNVKMRIERSAVSMELTNSVYGEGEKKPELNESK